jgi:sRNA-binding protein
LAAGQQIDVDGEHRTIVSVGTPAAAMTTLFVPVSTGPWITIPAGSTSLPVTNAAGFEAGEKIGIDIGGNYEVATVTVVGKAATQTTLAAAAAAGSANIKVAADANMMAGDTLMVGSGGRKESVTVKSIGTAGAGGTGVDLTAPLRFDHMKGIDLSDAGTGIGFSPATRFPHVSGDAVQALGGGITLDRSLARSHAYGAAVVSPLDTTAGYQGPPAPNQWFGATLSARAGSIALLDASGSLVVDAMVYGSQQSNSSGNGTIVSPEIATVEGDQGKGGCIVVAPAPSGGPGPAAPNAAANRSVGRFPDGTDTDSNCNDFLTQATTSLSAASDAGATNIKVASVADFEAGQTILIDTGANPETAVVAEVGTAGATTVSTAIGAGETVIPVADVTGFNVGQTISIDREGSHETAVVVSTNRRGNATIGVAAQLTFAHAAGAQISGSGITLAAGLNRAHASGTQVSASGPPTPGAPNQYFRRHK